MDVRGFDVDDDVLLRRFHELVDTADRFERPWTPTWSFEEVALNFREPDAGERWDAFAAFDDREMVGAGFAVLPLLDNTDKVYAGIFVEPAQRRRGIGTALVEHLVERVRAEGRTSVLVEAGIPFEGRETHPYRRFADALGFRMASVEVHRVLDLPLPSSELDALASECAAHHGAYRLHTFQDTIPDRYLDSYCYLENQLALDAPTGEIDFEAEAMTPEIFRERTDRLLRQGRHRLTTLAVTADDEAVAMTDLVIPREDMPKVHQWATLVRRDHRGHRLGMAVKVQNIRALQERYPERTQIYTSNEEANDNMVSINERLGFRPLEILPEFLLKLD